MSSSANPLPLEPILASHLLELEIRNRDKFVRNEAVERLATGCEGIDEYVLGGGGVERGVVIGVSAGVEDECGDAGRLISLHLLASMLLSQPILSTKEGGIKQKPTTKAIVIDTTGSFPVSMLARVLRNRLLALREKERRMEVNDMNHSRNSNGESGNINNEVGTEVQRCLEMVSISRAFDLEGMWEVLGEVQSQPAGDQQRDTNVQNQQDDDTGVENQQKHRSIETRNEKVDLTPEILDSEEDESINSDSPYMDQEFTRLRENTAQEPKPLFLNYIDNKDHSDGIEIIVLDNMTNIINELFARKEKTEGWSPMPPHFQAIY
ncbi:hypothetical protein B7463_g3702, partial [Scytalidium lignicola]